MAVRYGGMGRRSMFLHARFRRYRVVLTTRKLQSGLRLSSAALCEFGTDRAWKGEALLRKRRKGQVFLCLSGDKLEECDAQKIASSMCR
jgi:hypothetical protein